MDDDEGEADGGEEWIPCELAQILATDPPNATHVVVLREVDGSRAFPIHIGPFEWQAIHRPVHGVTASRPLTHDLLLAVIGALDATLAQVTIRDLLEDAEGNGTFLGSLVLARGDETVEVDCRPSDALALAAREGCPLLVARSVLDKVAGDAEDG